MSTADLILRPECGGCKTTKDLYGSNCKHLTLCDDCGKKMALNRAKCNECGAVVTRLIREYNVRASTVNDKNYFIGRFVTGLPSFSKTKNSENKWSLHKDGLQGRQLSDAMREKYKNKPWVLEDESGRSQYQGHLEGAQTATYYLLIKHPSGKEFSAIPAGSWFNFNKVAQYKQLTLEEAEEKISNRKKTADGYERWMMKAANNGAALFGEVERFDNDNGVAGGRGRKKTAGGGDDEEGNGSDRGDEDDEEELERKKTLNKRGGDGDGDDDDDDEGARGGDADMDDDDIEKGDDWEHEEIFTDDDEAVGNNPEEREDLEPEIPAPPEIKQDDEDEDEDDKEGGLSKSGKELKKLLGRSGGLDDSDVEDDDDDDDDMDDDIGFPSELAPKQKDAPKEEPSDNSPSKPTPSAPSRGTTSTSKSSKGKRKSSGDDAKASNNAPPKKVKSENEQKSIKEEPVSVPASKSSAPPKGTPPVKTEPSSSGGRVTEEEIRAVLMQRTPLTTNDLVSRFKGRLKSSEEKAAFSSILRRISKIKKGNSGTSSFIVLKER